MNIININEIVLQLFLTLFILNCMSAQRNVMQFIM